MNDVIQLTSKDVLIIGLQILKVSFDCFKASNFRSEKAMGDPNIGFESLYQFCKFFTFLYFAIDCLSFLKSICLYVTSIKVIFHVILKNTTEKARIMRYTR